MKRGECHALLAGALLLTHLPCAMSGQEVTPDTYSPPLLTMERLMQNDPTFSGENLWVLAADQANFRATLEKQAASGKLVAQIFLGAAYLPKECSDLPFKIAPADCPEDSLPDNALGLKPSFDLAIHWLTLASAQGSGEASEMLAQAIYRSIKSSAPSHYQMTDVAQYHELARSQGFDLQEVEYSCYSLDSSQPADRLIMPGTAGEFQFTPHELDLLHAAGASGTLRWRSTSIQSGITTLLQHPEGPKIRTRVILGRPPSHEMLVPMPDRVNVVYLQQGDRIVTLPSDYPAIRRKVSFGSPTAEKEIGAAFQAIDGTLTGGCPYPASPHL